MPPLPRFAKCSSPDWPVLANHIPDLSSPPTTVRRTEVPGKLPAATESPEKDSLNAASNPSQFKVSSKERVTGTAGAAGSSQLLDRDGGGAAERRVVEQRRCGGAASKRSQEERRHGAVERHQSGG
ncbi:hypothetical protein EYF80_009617 [Liparis tanakae]|uniref:Uncharacterized protein n=1 Tax=Liparis tanakae TaxID=230148 RepID=A0A4Z2IQG7_9TELE|nr:hypothetical protein EYF80_009617 [Liparis tanakae]